MCTQCGANDFFPFFKWTVDNFVRLGLCFLRLIWIFTLCTDHTNGFDTLSLSSTWKHKRASHNLTGAYADILHKQLWKIIFIQRIWLMSSMNPIVTDHMDTRSWESQWHVISSKFSFFLLLSIFFGNFNGYAVSLTMRNVFSLILRIDTITFTYRIKSTSYTLRIPA